ncbi:unnamed protein product [Fusarium graminearum]|nr:unnamed protein product [Fusarium graminearum]
MAEERPRRPMLRNILHSYNPPRDFIPPRMYSQAGPSSEEGLLDGISEATTMEMPSVTQVAPTAQESSHLQPHQQAPASQVASTTHGASVEQELQAVQQPRDIVEIRETSTKRGRGLFATQDIASGTNVIRDELPVLNGNFLSLILQNIPTEKDLSGRNDPHTTAIEDFRREYAFQDTAGRRCLIYKLASHINHACSKCAQARFSVDPGELHCIDVLLLKSVEADEEIFIHYGKKKLPFGCAICDEQRRPRKGWRDKLGKFDPRRLLRRNHQE